MAVLFEIPSALSRMSGDETVVELDGTTVGRVLAALWARYPKLESRVLDREGRLYPYLLLLHNGETLPQNRIAETPVRPGDRLELIALAEGG